MAFKLNRDPGFTRDALNDIVGAEGRGTLAGLEPKERNVDFTYKAGAAEKKVDVAPPWEEGIGGREFGAKANDMNHPIQENLTQFVQKLQQGPFPLYPPETDRMAGEQGPPIA